MPLEYYANFGTQTLLAGLAGTSTATTWFVATNVGYPSSAPFRVIIDTEILLCTASTMASGTFTMSGTRGAESSTIGTHTGGATVLHALTAGAMDRIKLDAYSPLLYLPASWASILGNYTSGAGNDTTGVKMYYSSLVSNSMKGLKFAWVGGLGTKTVKLTLWDQPTIAGAGTNLGSVSVTPVVAAGTYEGDFTSPISLVSGHFYTLAAWENGGSNYTYTATNSTGPQVPWQWGPFTAIAANLFSAGDAQPTSTAATERYLVEPVLA